MEIVLSEMLNNKLDKTKFRLKKKIKLIEFLPFSADIKNLILLYK